MINIADNIYYDKELRKFGIGINSIKKFWEIYYYFIALETDDLKLIFNNIDKIGYIDFDNNNSIWYKVKESVLFENKDFTYKTNNQLIKLTDNNNSNNNKFNSITGYCLNMFSEIPNGNVLEYFGYQLIKSTDEKIFGFFFPTMRIFKIFVN